MWWVYSVIVVVKRRRDKPWSDKGRIRRLKDRRWLGEREWLRDWIV